MYLIRLKHRLHSSYEKSIVVERAIEYLKEDRTEAFDGYFSCIRRRNGLQSTACPQMTNSFFVYA